MESSVSMARIMMLSIAMNLLLFCASFTAQAERLVHTPNLDFGKRKPICTDCHKEQSVKGVVTRRYNHTVYFAENHRFAAKQNTDVCYMCHNEKMCNDCHGIENELKPSQRYQTDTFRRMPHRGDYISRHRIDGRMDPTSCYRCHGNPKRSKTCIPCHG